MGFSSQAGQVVFKTQAAPGVVDPGLETEGVSIKLRSGSLAASRELLIPDAEIGGGRDVTDAYLGAVSFSGDFEFYARLNSLPTLMRACLGGANSTAVTGVNTHEVFATDASQLPFLSLQETIGFDMETFTYLDAVVNTLHLEAEANGYLMGTAGLIARQQEAGGTRAPSPVQDNTPLIVGTNILVTYGGVTLPAKSFSFDVNNNFEDDDFRLGSFFLGDLTPKRREVTASFGIRHQDIDLWRQATYGVRTAVAPGGLTTKDQVVITMTTYEDIEGATPPTKGSLQITLPKFILSPFDLGPSGDDIIESDVEGQAVRPDIATPVATFQVVNGSTTIA